MFSEGSFQMFGFDIMTFFFKFYICRSFSGFKLRAQG